MKFRKRKFGPEFVNGIEILINHTMTVACFKNGNEIEVKDPFDIDHIEYDVVKDYLKLIGHLEKNPTARVEIDYSEQSIPQYRLVNCSTIFAEKFNQFIHRRQPA